MMQRTQNVLAATVFALVLSAGFFVIGGIPAAFAGGSHGSSGGQISCSVDSTPGQNGSTTLTWSSTGAGTCAGGNFNTGGATSGTVSVSPNVTTTYAMSCSGGASGGGSTWQLSDEDNTDYWCDANGINNPNTNGFNKAYQNIPNCSNADPEGSACSTVGGTCKVNTGQCVIHTAIYQCGAGSGTTPAPATFVVTPSGYHFEPVASDALQHGGVAYFDTARADMPTANKICDLTQSPSHAQTITQTGSFNSPGDNSVVGWNGSSWYVTGAKAYNSYIKQITCVSDAPVTPPATTQCSTTVTVAPPPPPPTTDTNFHVNATKIVCDNESDLPNWGHGGPDITATTATDFLANHPSCHAAPNWKFEWANANASNPGDEASSGGNSWTAFGPTNASGVASTDIAQNSCSSSDKIWVREQFKSGYIPFSGASNFSDVSAEMYCSNDVLNYDNYDAIKNPSAGHSYNCVAWNVANTPPPPPPPPPTTGDSCGLDVALVLDTSGSIGTSDLSLMKSAFDNFIDMLAPATPTMFSVTHFDVTASVLQPFTLSAALAKAGVNSTVVGTFTNWEQGLMKAQSTYDPRPNIPNIIVFASDGMPNRYGSTGSQGSGAYDPAALSAAVTEANLIKAGGTRIITLGIGNQLTPANLQAISSPGDYYTIANFSSLGSTLRTLAGNLCGGTVTVHKVIDQDGDLSTTNDQTPGAGWKFSIAGEDRTTSAQGMTAPLSVTSDDHSITEYSQPGYSLIGATCTGAVQNGSLSGNTVSHIIVGNQSIVSCTFYNKPVSQTSATCTLNASALVNGSSNLTWTTSNATSFSIDHSVGAVTPVAGGSTSVSPTTDTTYTGTATGPGGTSTCSATVALPHTGPSCSLSLSDTTINTGGSIKVSWTSTNSTSGSIDHGVGNATPLSSGTSIDIFPPQDTTFTGTFGNGTATTTCSAFVHVNTGGGGGGCAGNTCPGGLNQPTVTLASLKGPGEAPLAGFVYLSQVPYTGFAAGPALTMIFWTAIALFSALIAYFVVGQGGIRYLLAYVSDLAGVPSLKAVEDAELENGGTREDASYGVAYPDLESADRAGTQYLESVAAPVMAPVRMPQAPVAPAPMPAPAKAAAATEIGIPPLTGVIESRAHAAGVLISPEAVSAAAKLSPDRAEALVIFGDILNKAIQTIPRDDGWVMLTSDRFEAVQGAVMAKRSSDGMQAPAAFNVEAIENEASSILSTASGSAAAEFVGAILGNDRDTAFGIIRSLEKDHISPTSLMTGTAAVLDRIYRLRKGGKNGVDAVLLEKSGKLDDAVISKLVEIFAHSLDQAYANPFTGVKLALAQAFETVG